MNLNYSTEVPVNIYIYIILLRNCNKIIQNKLIAEPLFLMHKHWHVSPFSTFASHHFATSQSGGRQAEGGAGSVMVDVDTMFV